MAIPTRGSRKKVEEDMQILEGSGEGDVGDAGVETRLCMTVDVHVDSAWAKVSEWKSTSMGQEGPKGGRRAA